VFKHSTKFEQSQTIAAELLTSWHILAIRF